MSADVATVMFFIVAIGICVSIMVTQRQLSILESELILQKREIENLKMKLNTLIQTNAEIKEAVLSGISPNELRILLGLKPVKEE